MIGGGSGGVRAARIAASLGARVALCEERYLGGTCVNVGCVPKKLMVYGSHVAHDLADAAGYGWTIGDTTHDWRAFMAAKDAEIARLGGVYRRLLEGAGVDVIDGRGTLEGPGVVVVGDRRFEAEHILVATGDVPSRPEIPGSPLMAVSDDLFYLPEAPKRVVIVGAGYIALEFAGIFHGFGAEVDVVHRGDHVLRGFDVDVRAHVERELIAGGIRLHLSTQIAAVAEAGAERIVTLDDGQELRVDLVVCACGRKPATRGMGLEEAGVAFREDDGAIVVDERFRTTTPGIYAVGDVMGGPQLTPVALAQGMWLARDLFGGGDAPPLDTGEIPTAVFCQPPVATVGLTEAEARSRHGEIAVYRSRFTPMKHTLSGRDSKTLMKLIVDSASDRVVGCHVVGPDAAEIVQGFAVAIHCGATKAQFDQTIGIHPTAAEELVTMRTPVTS